jgi:DNA repair exonuclease SbcCD nuclease subunit
MKFLHAADIHIDSPLKGCSFEDASAADRLRLATRTALSNLIAAAIEREVDFIIIAGDLFDGAWQDMRTGLWTAEQFRRLREHKIRVYLIRGNHDALSVVAPAIRWPEDVVHEFSTKKPETITDERSGAVLHGQSFSERKILDDMAKRYPAKVGGAFNIGVLHTSLSGENPEHDTYAPTSPEVLASLGYDYWALGHIHARRIIRTDPYIVYPGNTQGRHIKETGPKGCYLLTVGSDKVPHCEFLETDVVRWETLDIALENGDEETDLFDQLSKQFERLIASASGKPVIARMSLSGPCRVHQQLSNAQSRLRILAEIRNQANDFAGELWLEKIDCLTRPAVDIEELRQGGDIVGQLLRSFEEVRGDELELMQLQPHFQTLLAKVGDALEDEALDFSNTSELRRLLSQSENLLLAELLGGEA